jgi:hypothetical protein
LIVTTLVVLLIITVLWMLVKIRLFGGVATYSGGRHQTGTGTNIGTGSMKTASGKGGGTSATKSGGGGGRYSSGGGGGGANSKVGS